MPGRPVRRKDAVPEEIPPVRVEGLALPVVGKLGGEDGLDVSGVGREDDALAEHGGFAGGGGEVAEELRLVFVVVVAWCVFDCMVDEVEAWLFCRGEERCGYAFEGWLGGWRAGQGRKIRLRGMLTEWPKSS